MKKLVMVAVALLTLSALVSGPVLAGKPPGPGARKALLYDSNAYTCEDGAGDTSGPVFGFAIVTANARGDLIVRVALKRATPNETYELWVNQDPGACPLSEPTLLEAITTNRRGNGNARVRVPRVEGAKNFWASAVGGGQVLRSTAVILD